MSDQRLAYQWQFDLIPEQVTPEGSGSASSGQAWLYYDTLTDHLRVIVSWANLEADLTALHIHGPAIAGQSSRTHLVDIIRGESAFLSIPLSATLLCLGLISLVTRRAAGRIRLAESESSRV